MTIAQAFVALSFIMKSCDWWVMAYLFGQESVLRGDVFVGLTEYWIEGLFEPVLLYRKMRCYNHSANCQASA